MSYKGLSQVISGGQTGCDQGGLMAAYHKGVLTGGYAPAGWRTNNGPNPILQVLGLVEVQSSAYPVRTVRNVEAADATLILGFRLDSAGSRLTAAECVRLKKPFLQAQFPSPTRDTASTEITLIETIVAFIKQHEVKVLNVAGNRDIDEAMPNYHKTLTYVGGVLTLLEEQNLLIKRIQEG